MTICNLILDDESSQTGKTQQSSTSSSPALYLVSNLVPEETVTPDSSVSLDEFLNEFANDDEVQQGLARSRKSLAESFYSDEPETFTFLRLSMGLSQAEVAKRAETTQSYIARIEKGTADPGTSMIVRLAHALGVSDSSIVHKAVVNQRDTRKAKKNAER
ncbi:helix-turn-helix domain-containing protein [Marinobacter nauticus]|uniref:helix-turn-helix domain-containing protein n=1 Tax=Marinobacter nauticus TaxID=2743 RepID=UPI00167B74EC|nr:helix-turn-helix transcriptional regulator [Marinobacter nauticus]